ncbi:hypothetical protein KUP21_004260 [Salmonella enterica]|nr:hypothetical protein [Salmonella enterica]
MRCHTVTLKLRDASRPLKTRRLGGFDGVISALSQRQKKGTRIRSPFPGEPWQEEEGTLLLDALEDVPDEQIATHLFS